MKRLLLIAVALVLLMPLVSATWYNTTYSYKRADVVTHSSTGTLTNFTYLVNGSNGFYLNGNTQQLCWCRSNINATNYLYYNSYTDYAFSNGSENAGLNCDCEQSNVSINSKMAYGGDLKSVYHFSRKDSSSVGVDAIGTANFTYTNTILDENGKFGQGLYFDGTDDIMTRSQITYQQSTISLWIKAMDTGLGVLLDQTSGAKNIRLFFGETTGEVSIGSDNGYWKIQAFNFVGINSKWQHIVITCDTAGNATLYINGIFNGTDNVVGSGTGCWSDISSNLIMGIYSGGSGVYYFNGSVDELKIYNGIKTAAEIKREYEQGLSVLGSEELGLDYLSITAKDYYDATVINTFTAYVSNASQSWVLTTSNGTATTEAILVNSGLYNITVSVADYYNRTYVLFNSSSELISKPYQSVLNVFASEMITGYSLTGFNVTVPMQVNTTSGNNVTLYLKAGAYTLTFSKGGYFNQTKSYTAAARTTASTTITDVFNGYLNITAQSFNTTAINEFTVYAYGLNNYYTGNFTTTNGTVRFPVINGSYNLTMDAVAYSLAYHTIVSSPTMVNYTFSLYQTNTFFFYFKDIITKALVELSTLEMISGLFAGNYSAPNGTLNISLIVPGDYTFRYTAPGYVNSLYFFTLVNRTVNNITLYMTTNTSTTVTATVYDQIGNIVEGAVIKVLRYDLASNSYLLNEMAQTNFEGKTILHLTLNTEFYKFLIEYGGVLKKETEPGIILEDAIAFQIILGAEVGELFDNYQAIDYSFIFNNATDSFRLTYSDNNNLVSSVCVKVWKITGSDQTLLNTTCLSTAAGTILVGVTAINGTLYKGSAYVYYGTDEPYLLASLFHKYGEYNPTTLMGIFMVGLLTILFFCAGLWRPVLIPILTPLPVVIGSIIGLVNVPVYITVPLEVCGLIIAYVISDKS